MNNDNYDNLYNNNIIDKLVYIKILSFFFINSVTKSNKN